jgi:Predicted Na+-dependent transporter
MNVEALVIPAVKASLVLTVFAVGLRATPQDAWYLFRHPGLLARTLVSMSVVMPVIALWIAITFGLDRPVKLALVTLAMSPVPPFLPGRVTRAGGQPAYNVGVLAATSLLAIITVPLSVWAVGRLFSLSVEVRPRSIAVLVGTSVLLPLIVGIGVRRVLPGVTARIARPTTLIASVLLVVSFIPILVKEWPAIVSLVGNGTLAAILAMALIGLLVGHILGGPVQENRIVLALSTACRHPAVAIAIAGAAAPTERLVAAAVLLALIVSSIASIPYALWGRRWALGAGR